MGTIDPGRRGLILVVDDDDALRAEVRANLEDERQLVLEARDGEEALDILRSRAGWAIRLIIVDLVMPGMSGWELIEAVRRDPLISHIPVLVISGVPVHGDASGIGATLSSLRKPFGLDALVETVRSITKFTGAFDEQRDDRTYENGDRPSLPSDHDG